MRLRAHDGPDPARLLTFHCATVTDSDLKLRRATPHDIPLLVRHRRAMFEEMCESEQRPFDLAALPALDASYTRFLEATLDTTAFAWVIESQGRIAASGALCIVRDMPPSLRSVEGPQAYIFGVYTAPDARRQGLARRIVEEALAFAGARGIPETTLFASVAGRPLYESLGFESVTSLMRRVKAP